jgi:hypothetical protein
MPGLKVAVSDDLCKKTSFLAQYNTVQASSCLFCAIEIVGKKYDISVETMEIFHILLWPLQQKSRENLLVADL